MKIELEIDIPSKRIADMMVGFIETSRSIQDWCQNLYIKSSKEGLTESPWYSDPKLYERKDFEIEVHEDEDEDAENPIVHILNMEKLKTGLQVMAEKYPSHFSDMIQENDDAITADIFMQCCIFGETKYG